MRVLGRQILIAVMTLTTSLWFMDTPVIAAGNVLLPSEGSQFNLGLAPRKPAAPPATQKTDTPIGTVAGTPPAAPASVTSSAAGTAAPSTFESSLPSLTNDAASQSQPATAQATGTTHVGIASTAGLGVPTTVVQGANGITYPNGQQPSQHITVVLGPKSVWGPQDTKAVGAALGIDPGQVAANCRLSLSGMIMASHQVFNYDTMGGQRTDAYYNGPISNMVIGVKAMCPMSKLPSNSGFITQQGNSYTVPVGGANCPPMAPNRPPQAVIVTYAGNGNSSCQLQ